VEDIDVGALDVVGGEEGVVGEDVEAGVEPGVWVADTDGDGDGDTDGDGDEDDAFEVVTIGGVSIDGAVGVVLREELDARRANFGPGCCQSRPYV